MWHQSQRAKIVLLFLINRSQQAIIVIVIAIVRFIIININLPLTVWTVLLHIQPTLNTLWVENMSTWQLDYLNLFLQLLSANSTPLNKTINYSIAVSYYYCLVYLHDILWYFFTYKHCIFFTSNPLDTLPIFSPNSSNSSYVMLSTSTSSSYS